MIVLDCSNDAFDADMNVDGNKPESVVNLTGNKNGVLAAAWVCFAIGASWLWSLVTGQVEIQPNFEQFCAILQLGGKILKFMSALNLHLTHFILCLFSCLLVAVRTYSKLILH